ncbi:MAG: hypothetical protein V9E88_13150 [Ferruginibacter sp.]
MTSPGKAAIRLVLNAATRDKDLAWICAQAAERFDARLAERPDDLAMLAVQGPDALREAGSAVLDPPTPPSPPARSRTSSSATDAVARDGTPLFIARTGYTGEDGVEILAARSQARPGSGSALLAPVRAAWPASAPATRCVWKRA